MRFFHQHKWIYQERGIGTFQKGKRQLKFSVEGHHATCSCGKKMFFPDDPQLKPVEVD